MSYKEIMKILPTLQAVQLIDKNVKTVTKKKKVKIKDVVDLGTTNIIGTSLIKVNADLISNL